MHTSVHPRVTLYGTDFHILYDLISFEALKYTLSQLYKLMQLLIRINTIYLIILFMVSASTVSAQTTANTILIETSQGNIKCILYAETPMHTENFTDLSKKEYFDGMLFHRVIKDFMIQSGDPSTKNHTPDQGPGYTVPAEFHPNLYHKKGVLAAARQGDQVNPKRESSGSQFYIVQGKVISEAELDNMEKAGAHIRFTPEQRTIYTTIGGTPHLDYAYTVFGEVTEGLEVVDKIASVATGYMDRPVEDVKIIKVTVLK